MTTAKKAIRAKKDWTTFTFHSFGPKDIHSSRPLYSFKTVCTVRTVQKPSGWFNNCPVSLKTVRIVKKLSGRCDNCPDSCKLY